jgi:dTDP-4-dehydrorhamnose reductase
MPRILLIGASGQLGRAILATKPGEAEVLAYGRALLDLANPVSVEAALGTAKPDWVINAAAYTAVDEAESDAALAYRVNAYSYCVISFVND